MPLTNGNTTYSEVHGKKRKPQVLVPHVVYEPSMEFATDKETELIFVQHKLMREFLSKKKLVDEFNRFQETKQTRSGSYGEWFRKWN